MRHSLLGLAAVALAATGCPETLEKLCPPTSTPAGNFQLSFGLQQTADQCRQILYSDGGPADASIATNPAPANSTLCAELIDAGPTLYLAVQGKGVRASPLASDGGFSFVSTALAVPQTACGCSVDITETIAGNLAAPGDAGFTVAPDGGLTPPATSIAAMLVDSVSSDAGGCLCNVPCALHYTLTGTPN